MATIKENGPASHDAAIKSSKNDSSNNANNEEIAIVGIGCRFPGNADNPDKFWELLVNGRDGIIDIPEGRWDVNRFCDSDPSQPGRLYVKQGGFLQHDIRAFDPMFFGISPREADFLDPQQRLLLEVAWEAIDNAGIDADGLIGSNTGVYVGGFMMDSMITQLSPLNRDTISPQTAVGFTLAMLANRISYSFDLRGPSISLDTACSGSLVATHLACNGIWSGDCDTALVGGVNVMHRPEVTMAMCKGKFLAKDGRSKSFDAAGDGYGRGEGAGVVVLKRKSTALADGDRIYATIRATGCNQDGSTDGITVPNPESQAALIKKVCAKAGIAPADIRVFEAHGTGTALGDPLEASALGQVIGQQKEDGNECVVSSVKANIGHLEAAAGVAALIKTSLMLHHGIIPPLANLKTPNPEIPFSQLGLRLPLTAEPFAETSKPYLAGINSFGYGGTNAHVIMQRFTQETGSNDQQSKLHNYQNTPQNHSLLVASAADTDALKAYVAALHDSIAQASEADFANILFSSARRRTHHSHRLSLVTDGKEHALVHLDNWLTQGFDDAIADGQATTHTSVAPVFVFTGMGPQWWGMGQELYRSEPVFREFVDQCDQVFSDITGWSILEEMQADETNSRMADTRIAQPANFVLQAGLTELWKSRGIEPAAIVGHSVGEVTAGYVAGCYSLSDAIKISYHRSRLQKQAAGEGGMLALGCSEQDALNAIAPYAGLVSVAAINSSSSITLAGDFEALAQIAAQAETLGWFNRTLQVEVPYHSPAMERLKPETRECLADLKAYAPKIPLYSTVRAAKVETAIHNAEYWCDNIREPVLFAHAIEAILADGHKLFLEVGPHPVLSSSLKQIFAANHIEAKLVSSLRRGDNEISTFTKGLGDLHIAGCKLNWANIYPEGCFVELPQYPWQRQIHWNETETGRVDRLGAAIHPLLQRPIDAPNPAWESSLNARFLPFLADHQVQGLILLPGAAYVEAAIALHQTASGGGPCQLEDLAFRRALVIDPATESDLRVEAHSDGQFTIHSRRRGPQGNGGIWDLYADGRLSKQQPKAAGDFDPALALADCKNTKSKADHYACMDSRGLQYGPAFQGVTELHFNDDIVIARLKETTPDGDTWLNPTKLDACFQTLLTIMPEGSGTFLPTGIRKLTYRRQPNRDYWCYGRVVDITEEWLEADLYLYDEQGSAVEILGLRCQSIPDALDSQDDATLNWTYSQHWEIADKPQRTLGNAHFLVAGLGDTVEPLVHILQNTRDIRVSALNFSDKALASHSTKLGTANDTAGLLCAALTQELTSSLKTNHPVTSLVLDLGSIGDWQEPATAPAIVLLRVIQTVTALYDSQQLPRLNLITRGAEAVVANDIPTPNWGALVGLMRVAGTEYPLLRPCVIDLGIDEDTQSAAIELLADTPEDCSAWRHGERFVQRLSHLALDNNQESVDLSVAITSNSAIELRLVDPKKPETLTAYLSERSDYGAHQVEIQIEACALAPKKLQTLAQAGHAGCVAAGTVIGIGSEVRSLQMGDRLVICGNDLLRRYAVVDPTQAITMPIPEGISAQEAVALPLAFIKAIVATEQLGNLQAGETVLIHHDGTGMSLAVLQQVQQIGATAIIAVQGDAAKEHFKTYGGAVTAIVNLEQEDLETSIRRLTRGKGVDLLINGSQQVSALDVSVLAQFGRLVSLNGPGLSQNGAPRGISHRRDISVSMSDINNFIAARPEAVRAMLKQLSADFSLGTFKPLPYRTHTLDQLSTALSALTETQVLDDIVLDLTADTQARALPAEQLTLFRKDGSYLITGAFGGFGQALALWMAEGGAGQLILLSRRGEADPSASALRKTLESLGCRVFIYAADVADAEVIQQIVNDTDAEGRLPLCGVMHTAAVLDDASIKDLNEERFECVFPAKVGGAWNLHNATAGKPLDHFVLFSSVSAIIGNASQGNYVAANCILDSLAHYRRREGLAACSINWGALGDVGMAASDSKLENYLDSIGMQAFSAADALKVLARVLKTSEPQVGIMSLDWQRWKLAAANTASLPRFSKVVAEETTVTLAPEIQAHYDTVASFDSEEERLAWATTHLVVTVAKVLRLPVDRVKPELSLPNLGVDSLMNMDLVVSLRRELAIDVGALEILQGGSLQQIAGLILTRMSQQCEAGTSDAKGPAATMSAPSMALTNMSEENLLENLSLLTDTELEQLLETQE